MLDQDVVAHVGELMGGTVTQHAELSVSDRWIVVRATVAGVPVVLKQARTRQFDWQSGTPADHVRRFASETAALRFFAGDPVLAPLVPALLGVDEFHGCMVLSDLGAHGTLADVLLGSDPDDARRLLLEYATLLALFANRTRARVEEFDTSRGHAGHFAIKNVRDGVGSLSLPDGAAATVLDMCDFLERRRDHLTVGPVDACPDNVLVTPQGLRIVDFEAAAAYDAVFDAATLSVPFPSCWCHAAFDPGLRGELLAAHRDALDHDDDYDDRFEAVTVVWNIRTLLRMLESARAGDVMPFARGLASDRQRMRATAQSLAAASTGALHTWATALDGELARSWPGVAPPGRYPAFR